MGSRRVRWWCWRCAAGWPTRGRRGEPAARLVVVVSSATLGSAPAKTATLRDRTVPLAWRARPARAPAARRRPGWAPGWGATHPMAGEVAIAATGGCGCGTGRRFRLGAPLSGHDGREHQSKNGLPELVRCRRQSCRRRLLPSPGEAPAGHDSRPADLVATTGYASQCPAVLAARAPREVSVQAVAAAEAAAAAAKHCPHSPNASQSGACAASVDHRSLWSRRSLRTSPATASSPPPCRHLRAPSAPPAWSRPIERGPQYRSERGTTNSGVQLPDQRSRT